MQNHSKYPYEDILSLPHHQSRKHPQMSMRDRAAQFSPFSALTGYDDSVKEAARFTVSEAQKSEEAAVQLNSELEELARIQHVHPVITVTYFLPDTRKEGGSYQTLTGTLKKLDRFRQCLIFMDQTEIPFEHLFHVIKTSPL